MSAGLSNNNRNLERDLIILCSQTVILPNQKDTIAEHLRVSLDWGFVKNVGARNAVAPLIKSNLLEHFSELLPDEIREEFKIDFQKHVSRNMFLTGKLIEILRLFQASNVPALPFKGPVLALEAYKNLALRQWGDLDILVQPKDFATSVRLLTSHGYFPTEDVNWSTDGDSYVSSKKDIYFTNKDRSLSLEVHWKLSGTYFELPLKMEDVWSRSEIINVAGAEVSTFSFNHLFIYLCFHGSKHCWERLGWVCDINELIRSREHVDWESIFSESSRLGCRNILDSALRLIDEFYGTKVELPTFKRSKGNAAVDRVIAETKQRLFAHEPTRMKLGTQYKYHLRLKEESSDKWKLHAHYMRWFLRRIFRPNERDKELFYLPRLLAPLYYLVRPCRLFYSFLIRTKKEEA